MLAHLAQWILIAAIGQAPPEAALLKAAPADVDIALRVRGLEATSEDAVAAIKAMDAEWGNMAEGLLSAQVAEARQKHGAIAVKSPFLAVFRLGEPGGEGGSPPFAILLPAVDVKATIKALSGGHEVELKHQEGGYEAFDGPEGHGTWYAASVPGIVAVGPSKELIAGIAKRPARTLDSVVTGSAAKGFFGGDVGLYVNAASLTKRYADQIDQARQALMGLLDQAGQQAGNVAAMQTAKDIYGGLFDALKYADGLTLHLDAAEKGLHLGAFLKVKPGTDVEKSIAGVKTGETASLGRMPAGATFYVYMNVGARLYDRLQGMSLKMIAAGGKPSPEMEKAMAGLHGLGQIESLGSVTMDKGMISINEIHTADPGKYIEKSLALLRAMGGEGTSSLYKEVKVEPGAQKVRGISFTQATATIRMEKLAELAGNNPAQVETMKAMFADGRMNLWYGIDGTRILQVSAPKWEDARPLVEACLNREGGLGQTPGFRAVLSELPGRASFVMALNMQGMVRLFARQFATLTRNPDLKAPEDLPQEPAYLGAALTPHPSEGYEVHLVLPGPAGTVVARGMVPLFQALSGAARVNQ